MTKKQRKRLVYAISGCSILLSGLIWTAFLANRQMEREDRGFAAGLQETGRQTGTLSASLIKKDSNQPTPEELSIGVERNSKNVEPLSGMEELRQWELQNAYSISIPSIGVQTTVLKPSRKYWDAQEWVLLEEQMQVGLTHGAVMYPHSASPGRRGALIVAGHSSPPSQRAEDGDYGHLFARLPELNPGDEILVGTGAKQVKYAVQDSRVVPASTVSILQQQHTESVLKLITCFPVGTTRERLLVTAVPVG